VEFVQERVLLNCERYPGKRSVIILDNASIYKDRRLYDAYDQAGVLLRFLLLYLPDFNPIKVIFKDLKAWIRRNFNQIYEFEEFSDFLELAVQEVCRRDMRGYFRQSGYVVR
jgi:transposase